MRVWYGSSLFLFSNEIKVGKKKKKKKKLDLLIMKIKYWHSFEKYFTKTHLRKGHRLGSWYWNIFSGNNLNLPQAMNIIKAWKYFFRDISIAENIENPDSLFLLL